MSWNYRIVRHEGSSYQFGDKIITTDDSLAIHEVYYDEDDVPKSVTVVPVLSGDEGTEEESIKSIKWILEKMLEALDKPILDFNDF